MIVQSLIISEISVNLVEFLAKSDTHALNAHMVVSQNVVKNLITFFLHYIFNTQPQSCENI